MALAHSNSSSSTFSEVVLPHLGAAHRLARWLVHNPHDAEDVVQDASIRALRYFGTFTGGNGRAWFLRIVRNTCHARHAKALRAAADTFDEESHSGVDSSVPDPEALMLRHDDRQAIEAAMAGLSDRARQLLRLREIEELSYREMSEALDIPIGTVMSGLARARASLREGLGQADLPHRPAVE
jgi:RNA polymerase sigma-70 factor (ECF subfamily)